MDALVPDRPLVVYEGREYELQALDDLGLLDQIQLGRWMARIVEIEGEPKHSPSHDAEHDRLQKRLTSLALGVHPRRVERWPARVRSWVVSAFFTGLWKGGRKPGTVMARSMQASSWPVCSASTAATRRGG